MKTLYFSIFFTMGLLTNVMFVGFTLLYVTLGFSIFEIGILTSTSFLGSIFQPLLGHLLDKSKSKKKILRYIILILFLLTSFMLLFESFISYLILVLLISIFRMSILGIFEEISLTYAIEQSIDFPTLRSGASWGYSLGLVFVIPFVLLKYTYGIIYFTLIVFLITYILLNYIKDIKNINKDNLSLGASFKFLLNKKIILLLFSSGIIMSSTQLKLVYQNILLENLNAPFIIIALANFFTVSFELYLMSRFSKIFRKFSVKKLFVSTAFIISLQLFLFSFVKTVPFVLITVFLHGISMSIFIPSFAIVLGENVAVNLRSTAFLVNIMVISLFTSFIGFFIITPITNNLGLRYGFLTLSIFSLVSLIPTIKNDI